jgi:hypothetical protein
MARTGLVLPCSGCGLVLFYSGCGFPFIPWPMNRFKPPDRSPISDPARRDRRRTPAGFGAVGAPYMVRLFRYGRRVCGGAPGQRRGDGGAHTVEICRRQGRHSAAILGRKSAGLGLESMWIAAATRNLSGALYGGRILAGGGGDVLGRKEKRTLCNVC